MANFTSFYAHKISTHRLRSSHISLLMEITCHFFPLSKQHRNSSLKTIYIQNVSCADGLYRPCGTVSVPLLGERPEQLQERQIRNFYLSHLKSLFAKSVHVIAHSLDRTSAMDTGNMGTEPAVVLMERARYL